MRSDGKNRLRGRLAFWGCCLACLSCFSEEAPVPSDQDRYSGKKIESPEQGYEMIRDRFYNAPKYGDPAPDFELVELETREAVSLFGLLEEKPVVLLFGSYGCDVFRDGIEPLLLAHKAFGNDYEFVMVYVREAHSLDRYDSRERAMIVDPDTFSGRMLAAASIRTGLKIPFRILVDTMDDKVATRWAGWPVRAFVVEQDGTVVYSGRPGPWGYNPGGGFKPELSEELRPHKDRFNQESLESFLKSHKLQKELKK